MPSFQGLGSVSGTSAERTALTGMPAGTEFYESDTGVLYTYTGSVWDANVTAGNTVTFTNKTLTSPVITNPTITGPIWVDATTSGQVSYFALSSAPSGWLKANGAAVSRTTYSALFTAIGTNYGVGNGSTTFNLPDYRGEFLRCWADGSGTDSGRTLHSFQDYDWKGFYQSNTGQNTTAYNHNNVYMGKSIYGSYTGNLFVGYWAAPSAAMGTAWDGSEIRPRNRALLACIKY